MQGGLANATRERPDPTEGEANDRRPVLDDARRWRMAGGLKRFDEKVF